jgi:hypothetical protein
MSSASAIANLLLLLLLLLPPPLQSRLSTHKAVSSLLCHCHYHHSFIFIPSTTFFADATL